jgi:hypothetical protein
VGREGDQILVCTSERSLKATNTLRDPRVALSLVDLRNPYEEAQLRGRVVERRPDPNCAIMDLISHKYTGLLGDRNRQGALRQAAVGTHTADEFHEPASRRRPFRPL